jgi:hypothetical protein
LPIGWKPVDLSGPCWTFPESNGRIIGISRRYRDGTKKAEQGGARGLTIPEGWQQREGPVFCPEGPSDVLALTAMGLAAIGRPSNTGGVEQLAELLKFVPTATPIVILGELDPKQDGKWPGRDGAIKVATDLAAKLDRRVSWALPPEEAKDVRQWVLSKSPDPTCADEWSELGQGFVRALKLQEVARQAAPLLDGREAPREPAFVPLSAVQPQTVEWLWRHWTPRGAITTLDGDPGLGKSCLTLDLAARVSRGWEMPSGDGLGSPANAQGGLSPEHQAPA